ncbi:MAG: hypothetical protein JO067_03060 [Cupriavidus sp.]|nr:hypothetical protein [Cupriavidus sp.]
MDSFAPHTLRALCSMGAVGVATLAAAPAAVNARAVPRDFVYTVDVQIRDGRTVQCAVNEPPHYPAVPAPALTVEERVEAEVLATQRLRLLSGPRGPYPSGDTAPAITCFAIPG